MVRMQAGNDESEAETERRVYERQRRRPAPPLPRSQPSAEGLPGDLLVPGFVGVWAIGYSTLALYETQGEGLGDLGGQIGVAFACSLLAILVCAALYETLKPSPV